MQQEFNFVLFLINSSESEHKYRIYFS